jgi:hypothetical protein
MKQSPGAATKTRAVIALFSLVVVLAVGLLALPLAEPAPSNEPTPLPRPESVEPRGPLPSLPLSIILLSLIPLMFILAARYFTKGRGPSSAVILAAVLGMLLLSVIGVLIFFALAR